MGSRPSIAKGWRSGRLAIGCRRLSGNMLKTFVLVLAAGCSTGALACALEPMINGGFSVSHPASINVAVAVANARREGLLPQADAEPVPNDVQLNRILADLRKLQSRLSGGRKSMDDAPRSFSFLLVGPGLWSHFFASRGAVLARYHTEGPLSDKATVITHHAVLQALLGSSLTAEEATERGLLTYADGDTAPIRQIIETGLEAGADTRRAVSRSVPSPHATDSSEVDAG